MSTFNLGLFLSLDPVRGLYDILVTFLTHNSNETFELWLEVRIVVPQKFGLDLVCAEPLKRTIPGGILDFEINIHNTGNGLDTFIIDLLGYRTGWLTYIQPPEVTLMAGKNATIQIRVIVPSMFDEVPSERYTLNAKVESGRSEAQALYDLVVIVERFYRVEWVFADKPITDPENTIAQEAVIQPPLRLNPHAETHTFTTLSMQNLGNSMANVTISCEAYEPDLAITFSQDRIGLPHGGETWITVGVDVTTDMPPGEYPFKVIMTVDDDPDLAPRVVPIQVELYTLDVGVRTPIIITGTSLSRDPDGRFVTLLGGGIDLRYTLENLGSTETISAIVSLFHIGPDLSKELIDEIHIRIPINKAIILRSHWTASEPGEHIFEVEVDVDDQSNNANDLSSITIHVAPIPEISQGRGSTYMFIGAIVAIAVVVLFISLRLTSRREDEGS
jgi:hypothetical protein